LEDIDFYEAEKGLIIWYEIDRNDQLSRDPCPNMNFYLLILRITYTAEDDQYYGCGMMIQEAPSQVGLEHGTIYIRVGFFHCRFTELEQLALFGLCEDGNGDDPETPKRISFSPDVEQQICKIV
jgi:hypothetical protein